MRLTCYHHVVTAKRERKKCLFLIPDKVLVDDNRAHVTTVSRANSDGTVDTSSQLSFITSDQHFSVCFCFKHSFKHNLSSMA